jgi:uncharacterized membrane protein YidH (DUF202 family)
MIQDIIKGIYICGGLLIAAVSIVTWSILNTPFIRFKETEQLSSLFYCSVSVVIGFLIALIIGGYLTVKEEGVKFND